MFWYYFGTLIILKIASCQELVSPCPDQFKYEIKPNEPDRWYGEATLKSDVELNGIWFRILLDKKSLQLGNWFGEVETRDNNMGYLIKNPNHKLSVNQPLKIRFYVRFNPNEPPPKLVLMRLNARQVCPDGKAVTEAPGGMGMLFTNKPEITDPLSTGNAQETMKPGSGVAFPPASRPPVLINTNQDDYFNGDYAMIRPFDNKETVLLDAAVCGTVVKQPRPLITHGTPTHEGEFPWHAALYHSRGIDLTYICGASLVSLQHLITVAHCVARRKSPTAISPENLVVYLGKHYLRVWTNPGIQDSRVESIIIHPKYNPQTFSNDIAVIKLTDPVKFTNYVRPVCLWEGPSQLDRVVDQIGIVAGWGFDETGIVTEQLTKANMPIVSQETCIYSFPDFYSRFTSSSTFCAGFKNDPPGTSVCNGDSGGGLVLPKTGSDQNNPVWQIRGLVSISVALQNRIRCDSMHYVVFTDVAKYLDFIKKALLE